MSLDALLVRILIMVRTKDSIMLEMKATRDRSGRVGRGGRCRSASKSSRMLKPTLAIARASVDVLFGQLPLRLLPHRRGSWPSVGVLGATLALVGCQIETPMAALGGLALVAQGVCGFAFTKREGRELEVSPFVALSFVVAVLALWVVSGLFCVSWLSEQMGQDLIQQVLDVLLWAWAGGVLVGAIGQIDRHQCLLRQDDCARRLGASDAAGG